MEYEKLKFHLINFASFFIDPIGNLGYLKSFYGKIAEEKIKNFLEMLKKYGGKNELC